MSNRFRVFVVCVVVAGASSNPARGDEVFGAIWLVKNQMGREWQFRAGPRGVVWTVPESGKPEKLGTWSGNRGETVMNIDAPDQGGIGNKRTIRITLVGKNPLRWQGQAELPNGKKIPLMVTLVKD